MPSRSIIRTGVGPHREPGNRFPAMAAINLLAARAARVQSRRNLSRSLSPKLDHSHSITRFDRSRTGPKVKNSLTMNELSRGARLGAEITRWMLGRPNILALSPSLVHWFWKSREGLNAPDLQGVFTPASYREGYIGMLDDYPGMTCGVWQHRPESVGYVHARSSNPFQDPVVQPNYLEDPRDQEVLLGGMRVARRLMQTPELAKFFDAETLPGKGVTTDDELLDYARRVGVSCYHVMGTARMGPSSDPSAVVDDELRVHGVTGLRVVDASVMPNMPSANICASTMMIGEKAADMIRGLPPSHASRLKQHRSRGQQQHPTKPPKSSRCSDEGGRIAAVRPRRHR